MATFRLPYLKPLLLTGIVLLAAFLRLYKIDSLPPGETYDPAYYGVDALGILQGDLPVFLHTNFGREPMFSYIVAICVAVFGVGSLAIHFAAAIVGVVTVPVVYLAAEELFADEEGWLKQVGGTMAALILALSYWHLNWSRQGVRAILVPLFAALTFYFLWRGLRTGRRWAFVACGISLGFSMYTYQAARLLPLLVLVGFLAMGWSRRSWTKRDWLHLVLVAVISAVITIPLGYHAVVYPDSFSERFDQVFVFGDTGDKLGAFTQGLVDTVLVFSFRGDEWVVTTIPGRPVLDPFLSIAFVLGVGVCLLRIKKPAYLFVLAWLLVMCIPGVLAQRGPVAKRIIGSLPAVTMLGAIGVVVPLYALLRWTRRHSGIWARILAALTVTIVVCGFAYSGVCTYRDYFIVWGQNPNLFTHFEAGLAAIGQYIGSRPSAERIYVSPVDVYHPSVVYNSRQRPGVKGYDGELCIVLPDRAAQSATYIVVPGEDGQSLDLLARYLPQGVIVGEGPLHYNQPYFLAYHVPAGAEVRVDPAYTSTANWGGVIRLLGYDLSTLEQGQTARLKLYYQAVAKVDADYTLFVHLLGPHNPAAGNNLWVQYDSEPCKRRRPTSSWDVDEILIDEVAFDIPADLPEGNYELAMGFYHWPTMERLPVVDADGEIVGDYTVLKSLHLP